jgi:hypothetical protein
MKKLLLLLFAALAIPKSTHPTSILLMIVENNIVVAADSKKLYPDGHSDTVCKIRHVGKYYYAMSASKIFPKLFYYCDSILKTNKAIHSKINLIGQIYKSYLDTFLVKSKAITKEYLDTMQNKSLIRMGFFYSENNLVHIDALDIGYRCESNKCEPLPKTSFNNDHVTLGFHDLYGSAEAIAIKQKYKDDAVAFATEMVKLEMRYHTREIGCPIDRLTMDSTGHVQWFPREYCN